LDATKASKLEIVYSMPLVVWVLGVGAVSVICGKKKRRDRMNVRKIMIIIWLKMEINFWVDSIVAEVARSSMLVEESTELLRKPPDAAFIFILM
jgi:hypothetical protein